MRTYLRHRVPGGTYFFTANLAERKHNDLLIRHVETLRGACRYVQQRHPFVIEAMVVFFLVPTRRVGTRTFRAAENLAAARPSPTFLRGA